MNRDLHRPIMAVMDHAGPLSTGEICDLITIFAPVAEMRPIQHGRSGTNINGPHWEICPSCHCREEVEVSRPYLAPRVRQVLKKLKYKRLVIEIKTPVPNNKGGHLWLRADQADEYYRGLLQGKDDET